MKKIVDGKLLYNEVIRFIIVGVCATCLHYAIYLVFNLWLVSWLAYSVGYGISFIFNFCASSAFTFKSKATFKKGIGFVLSHLINYILQICLLSIFISIGISDKFAPIPVFMVTIPTNFLLVRFVFKSKRVDHD